MFTPVNSPSPSKRAREEHPSPTTPKRYRGRRWYRHEPYASDGEEASVLGDALVESSEVSIPQFENLQVAENDTVAGPSAPLDDEDVEESSDEESSGLSDAPDTIIEPLMEYDESPSKNKGRAMSKEPSKSRSPSVSSTNVSSSSVSSSNVSSSNVSSSNDIDLRQKAIEYLSRRCLGKVKGLEKGSVDLKPVLIVKQPVFDARSPMFAVACCLRCSKMVGSEGLFCVRPSKHSKCYRCANNGVPCEPIPAPYKAEFAELQTLFQTGALVKAFAARDRYLKGVNAFAHNRSSKPKAKPRAGSVSAGLSDEYKAYWDRKYAMLYRNQERLLNYMCKQNGDPPVRPIEELFDDEDEDAFAGYVENSDDEPAA